MEALGDANTVAPATRTADLHSQSRRNSYLYVFDYQSKFGDYPQVRSRSLANFSSSNDDGENAHATGGGEGKKKEKGKNWRVNDEQDIG